MRTAIFIVAFLAATARAGVLTSGSGSAGFTGTLPVANGGTGGATASAARSSIGAAASGANADITSLTGPVSLGSGATVSTFTSNGSLNLAAGASLQQNGAVLFSSAPVGHVCGPIIVGSLASGTTFMAFTPDAAITVLRIGCAVEVAGVGGSGDTVKCNNAAGTGLSVTMTAAAAAGTYSTSAGNAAIAYQAPVSCHIDSGAATRPIMTCCLEYVMQ